MFGGRALFHPTVDYSQVRVETVTRPAAVFCADLAGAPTVGKQLVLDAGNRMALVNGTAVSAAGIGWIGAVGASCTFNNSGSAGAPGGSFNVASVVRTGTGAYTINFTTALVNATYMIMATPKNVNDKITFGTKSTTSCNIVCSDETTLAAADLRDLVDVTIIGRH